MQPPVQWRQDPIDIGRRRSGTIRRGFRYGQLGGLLLAAAVAAACSQGAHPSSAPTPAGTVQPTTAAPPPASASTGGPSSTIGSPGAPTSPLPPSSPNTAPSAQPSSGTPAPAATPPALHQPLTLQAGGRLPGEGRFHAVVTYNGRPVLQVAYLRADSAHGTDEAGVAWFDHTATRYELHPGWADPGQLSDWNQPDLVPTAERPSLVATFNGGFKTPELRGGFYENGHVAGQLLPGAASVVIYRDGHVGLGSWGSEVGMTSQVVAVRQNLRLLIDHGRITGGLADNVEADWGLTIGGGPDVWRSGVGVTPAGDFVLVMGDDLTPQTLANLLLDAGAVRGMEMDINPAWMSFMWYSPGRRPAEPVPHKLLDFQRPADRYFTDTSRDFFAIYLR